MVFGDIDLESVIGWVQYDEESREQVQELMDRYKSPGTVDELGFSQIRDRLSNLLAPGVSTIQTRVRYFLFIPWIFRSLEDNRISPSAFRQELKKKEVALIDALDEGRSNQDIIGIAARENLQRFPSTIYWGGMKEWGILRFDGTLSQYVQTLPSFYRRGEGTARTDDGELISDDIPSNWHRGLPSPEDEFLEETSFRLREDEANYLRERILDAFNDHSRLSSSLLSQLADRTIWQSRDIEASAPWELPFVNELPESTQSYLRHARNFSFLTLGANYLYNYFCAREKSERGMSIDDEVIDELENNLSRWWEETLKPFHLQLSQWFEQIHLFRSELWDVHHRNWSFFVTWLEKVLSAEGVSELMNEQTNLRFFTDRERYLKGSARAKLTSNEALAEWNNSPTGTDPMLFRWAQLKNHINDIYRGLQGEGTSSDV